MIHGEYNLVLVVASIIVAFFSSHTATELAVTASQDRSAFSFFGAVLTFGVGAWAAHFIALLSLDLVGIHELFGITFSLLGLLCIVISTGLAAYIKDKPSKPRRIIAATILTFGLTAMHSSSITSLVLHVPIAVTHPGFWFWLAPLATFVCCWLGLSYLHEARISVGNRFQQTLHAGIFFTMAILSSYFLAAYGTDFIPGPVSVAHSFLPFIDSSTPTLAAVIMMTALSLLGAVLTHSHRVQHETAGRLEEAYKEAVRASGVKGDFLAVMSHELRTPLTAVMGYAELLLDGCVGKLTVEQADMLKRIDASSKHLLSLIQQVLDISRAERGRLEVQVERFDVCDLLKRTITIMDPLANKKGLPLHINVPRQRCVVDTDIGKLRQVIVNLVGNAIKFTDVGSITVELLTNNNSFTLTIRDTGIGIPNDEQGRVFDAFYQVGGNIYNRSREGAGLGLTISREIILLLHGSLTCESREGIGSIFTIVLPRVSEVALVA
jgi:signal transduction histidine kinase